jgi:D-ribose pyranose/furanose isomerase RbsD
MELFNANATFVERPEEEVTFSDNMLELKAVLKTDKTYLQLIKTARLPIDTNTDIIDEAIITTIIGKTLHFETLDKELKIQFTLLARKLNEMHSTQHTLVSIFADNIIVTQPNIRQLQHSIFQNISLRKIF